MVSRGQFLERPTLIPSGDVMLEGLSHRGDFKPGLLILPPPLAEGGGMDHLIAAELAFATAQAGFPSLRFNYRGVGASQGVVSIAAQQWLEDAQNALALARENHGTTPLVATIGASDAVGLRLSTEDELVPALVIVSPSLVRPRDVAQLSRVKVIVASEDDCAAEWKGCLSDNVCFIPHADRRFERGLPAVGKAVVEWLCLLRKNSSFSQAETDNQV